VITWKINGKQFIIADANDPDLLESLRISHLEVKERNKLLHLEVEASEDSMVVKTSEHTFFAKSNPFELGTVCDWELPIVNTFELVCTIDDFAANVLLAKDW
jgi:hypothetical protein